MPKQPKYAQEPAALKSAKAAIEPTSYLSRKPSWRIWRMEFVDPFGWHIVDANVMQFIRSKLANFETMTWDDIILKAKKQNHTVALNQLCPQAQKRLKDLHLEDLDGLLSLRLAAKQRVWGIFAEGLSN